MAEILNEVKPTLITTHHEVDAAAHKAIHGCIKLLPNLVQQRRDEIGKCHTPPAPVPTQDPTPYQGLMWPTGPALNHPAAPLLDYYSKHGCPVDCGPDWTVDQILPFSKDT